MAVCCATVEDENLFLEYFSYVLESLNLHHPTDWREALAIQDLKEISIQGNITMEKWQSELSSIYFVE